MRFQVKNFKSIVFDISKEFYAYFWYGFMMKMNVFDPSSKFVILTLQELLINKSPQAVGNEIDSFVPVCEVHSLHEASHGPQDILQFVGRLPPVIGYSHDVEAISVAQRLQVCEHVDVELVPLELV